MKFSALNWCNSAKLNWESYSSLKTEFTHCVILILIFMNIFFIICSVFREFLNFHRTFFLKMRLNTHKVLELILLHSSHLSCFCSEKQFDLLYSVISSNLIRVHAKKKNQKRKCESDDTVWIHIHSITSKKASMIAIVWVLNWNKSKLNYSFFFVYSVDTILQFSRLSDYRNYYDWNAMKFHQKALKY